MSNLISCPVCNREFENEVIEQHVNKCLFLNTQQTSKNNPKRSGPNVKSIVHSDEKRIKLDSNSSSSKSFTEPQTLQSSKPIPKTSDSSTKSCRPVPLAEFMRPHYLNDIVGQKDAFGPGSMIRSMLEQKKIPNMILWGPTGCGKTSLANVVATICKEQNNLRFVKLSATMAGINDVKEVFKVAKNEAQFKRQTVLFMDEIHRFNKLQQDTFLPHVENGTIVLIGATTENPSFSLNNALLSRCRVVVMEKLSIEDIMLILERALDRNKQAVIVEDAKRTNELEIDSDIPKCLVERASLQWLAGVCDGDARVALGALELALSARDPGEDIHVTGPSVLSLEDIKNGIKRSHMLYDRQGEEHYNAISALHKAVRAGDDNAALYWTARMMHGGEDPVYIARRLVRMACEDIGCVEDLFSDLALAIRPPHYRESRSVPEQKSMFFISKGLADPTAIVQAVACLQGCQHIGMPECDVLLAQCAVRLARASKSREVYNAMVRCQRSLTDAKGPLPPVPLHLRNAPTKLMKQIGYGRGYNLRHKDESGLTYMPEGMQHVDFFRNTDNDSDDSGG